ncbi:MAG: Gfo/Idh/MocA family oxidoreductase [Oscillospiraceae bacterium]|nr:Gfo/Idh/MocA family oxidoreductase [Oscillospiraceae bacterium]
MAQGKPVNVALAGLGNIAPRAAAGIRGARGARLYAAVSGDAEKARRFAREYGAEKAYSPLAQALGDPAVELIYLCTPNPVHEAHIRQCLEAGKHVLCEKPMVASAEAVRALYALARQRGLFLMPAEKCAFTPLMLKLQSLVDSGAIGELRAIRADYAYRIDARFGADHWVMAPGFGGCAYDVGVYPACFANLFAKSPIADIQRVFSEPSAPDSFMSALIRYGNGVVADVSSSWLWSPDGEKGRAFLGGTEGYIAAADYWKSDTAVLVRGKERTVIRADVPSEFSGEIAHACACIRRGLCESPVMGEAAVLDILRIVGKK